MPRKAQSEPKKRQTKKNDVPPKNKNRRTRRKRGNLAARLRAWGISPRLATGLLAILILILLGLSLIHGQFAPSSPRQTESMRAARTATKPHTAPRESMPRRDASLSDAQGTRQTRQSVTPPQTTFSKTQPPGHQPPAQQDAGFQDTGPREADGSFPGETPAPFEEQHSDRLEDAVKRVDALLLEALDTQGLPYSVHMSDVEWREEAGELYHFQRLLVLFQGRDQQKNHAVEQLRDFLQARFRGAVPATSLTELTENRWYVSIGGVATHELLFAAEQTEPAHPEHTARLAILIDDIGENKAMLREFLALDIPMAFAVLPHSTHARECADIITRSGHELLLHQPMEPERFPAVKPGPGALYVKDNQARIASVLADNMARVPGIMGINNHMGSRFSSNVRSVGLFLQALPSAELFILDSLTSPKSKLYNAARRMGLTAYRRDVFLDDVSDRASILHELEKAARLAQTQGHALAIGHPRPETLAVLKEWLRTGAHGITFSRLEDLQAPGE